ncbi:Transposon Ty3-I Gag-Pol polyprotein [Araneus ventricosus]|uniref:Transposon Ty3-I Gag-Pol polyprotein n=1 Tax=Araneus ventricosus TaxID=182803 RepID=A0A4Y2H3S6_ARAVE|nr:Transposon Ty3-I Gag-Pol polyprotein [Araneus ventricosus]
MCSPVVLLKKKDVSWLPCVDYSRLNKITKKDVYHLGKIDYNMLSPDKDTFSSLDLYSSYWQIEVVDEKHREKTALITPEGLYELKVIPFGLRNTPAAFERMIDNPLHMKWRMFLCYLGIVIVFSETFDELLKMLCSVLEFIQTAGNILNRMSLYFELNSSKNWVICYQKKV